MISFLIGSLVANAAALSGHYAGTKSIMGYHIKVDMKSGDTEGFFSLVVTGAPSGNVNCPKEAYTLEGSVLDMPNFKTAGDCAHDQFKKAKLKFKGASYDAASDTITLKSKYLFVGVTIICHKQSNDVMLPVAAPVLSASTLSGHYVGTKKIMGYHIKVDMKAAGEGFFSLSVTGSPGGDINCPKEAYTIDGSTVDMPGYKTAGDCAHDQFKKAKLKFKGAVYDAAADTLTLKSKYLFVGVTIVCHKQDFEMEGDSIAPLERILNKIGA